MGDVVKKTGGSLSSYATMGAATTTGHGWAQKGGSIKGALNDLTFEAIPALNGDNDVPIPAAGDRPDWNLSTPDGRLRSDLMLNGETPGAAKQSQSVLDSMITRASTAGPTQSAKYLMDSNNRNMVNALGDSDAVTRSGMANQISQMATRGGVDAGSRERLGKAAGMSGIMGQQKIRNDANGANLNILAQDEQQKTQMMQALPAQLLNQAGFEQNGKQFDISNTLNTVGGKYGEDMRGWAASQAAREQAILANKKGGLLGLGIAGIL